MCTYYILGLEKGNQVGGTWFLYQKVICLILVNTFLIELELVNACFPFNLKKKKIHIEGTDILSTLLISLIISLQYMRLLIAIFYRQWKLIFFFLLKLHHGIHIFNLILSTMFTNRIKIIFIFYSWITLLGAFTIKKM